MLSWRIGGGCTGYLMVNPCTMPDLFPDIFLPYHFWRNYDCYPWPQDYVYDEYGESGENREYPNGEEI